MKVSRKPQGLVPVHINRLQTKTILAVEEITKKLYC